jgi:hypothetical protein
MTPTTPGAPADEAWRALRDSLDQSWSQLWDRLDGLTDVEALWEPTPNCWTVRANADGSVTADWADPDPVPAPVTTIAWRMWHIAVDALDGYSSRAFDRSGTGLTGTAWVLDVGSGLPLLERAWWDFSDVGPDGLFQLLGPGWGPYADSTILALALHAQREIVHHGAEIGLLRDLYAASGGSLRWRDG